MGGAKRKSERRDVTDSVDYVHAAHEKKKGGKGRSILYVDPPAPPFIPTSSSLISIYRHCVPHLQALGRWICTIKRSRGLGEGRREDAGRTHHLSSLSVDLQAQEQVSLQANVKTCQLGEGWGGDRRGRVNQSDTE